MSTDVLDQIDDLKRTVRGFLVRNDTAGDRTMTFRATSESIASDGGILVAKGGDFTRFEKNPQLLWMHGMTWDTPPNIGHVVGWKRTKDDDGVDGWDFTVRFFDEGVSDLADQVYRIANAGPIAMSIGFLVTKFRSLGDEERKELGLSPWGWVGERWELHEASVVPVGADPTAVKRSLGEADAAWFHEQASARRAPRVDANGLSDLDTTRNDAIPTPPPATAIDAEPLITAIRDMTAAIEANTATSEALREQLLEDEVDDQRGADDTAGDQAPDAEDESDSKRQAIDEAMIRLMELVKS